MANYLNKRDMLKAIHTSKKSYCSYAEPRFADHHVIVRDRAEITDELIAVTVHRLAHPKTKATPKIIVEPEDVVIRLMTFDHVPDDPERKRRARNIERNVQRTPFPPFVHLIRRDGKLIEVGRSHWKGTLEDGEFCVDHGRINDTLARMFMLLVDRISSRGNYRNYSFLTEMAGNALVNLCQNGLQFDESKSDNPFAFYTTTVNHSFARILNVEKRQRDIRDDILQAAGQMPSLARQMRSDS